VRIVGEDDVPIEVCPPDRLGRYLGAANAEVKRRKDGSIKYIRLLPCGDDRGHLGENHGRSTVMTERVRNDWGALVGSDLNLAHKQLCTRWESDLPVADETTNKPTKDHTS
jgi:hypothetical protein